MLKFKNKTSNYLYLLIYVLITLIILNTLMSGYILTLDMVFTPDFKISNNFYGLQESISSNIPFLLILKFFTLLIPTWIIQKLILFFILFLSGISAYKLCPAKNKTGKLFAGLIYMINPFVYIRFMAGHYLLLLAYAITPFAIISIIKFFDKYSIKQTIKTTLWITLIGILNIHTLFLVLFVFLIFLIYNLIKNRTETKSIVKSVILIIIFFLVLNTYWLLPLATADSNKLQQITEQDLALFSTKPSLNLNVLTNTAAMYGFWRGGYILPKNIIPIWLFYTLFFLILYLTVHGYITTKNKNKNIFLIVGITSLILAVGITSNLFSKIFEFLFQNLFFFKGFREPHKFIALLVLVYSYLGGLGVANLKENTKKMLSLLIIILTISLPIIYTITMFNGFWGQLESVDYPQDWYEVNNYLNQDKDDFNILFLPWHMYIDFTWIPNKDKRISNPAMNFFDKPVIQGDNIEAGNIYSQSTNPISKYIEFLLKNGDDITNLGNKLTLINVKYVILTKEVDYKNYEFLYKQKDIELVKETENLIVFKNKEKTSRIYEVDKINRIKDWDELLKIEDVTNAIYILDNQNLLQSSEKHMLNYTKKSQVEYIIEKPTKKYLIFTDTYSKSWKLSNNHYQNIVTNAYEIDGNKNLKYTRFNIYLFSYIISSLFFILLIFKLKRFRY